MKTHTHDFYERLDIAAVELDRKPAAIEAQEIALPGQSGASLVGAGRSREETGRSSRFAAAARVLSLAVRRRQERAEPSLRSCRPFVTIGHQRRNASLEICVALRGHTGTALGVSIKRTQFHPVAKAGSPGRSRGGIT